MYGMERGFSMEQYGISKLDLKRRNRMQILKQLQQQGPTSRIDLSASLELTRAAVTIITNEMIAQGILYEKGEVNTAGQKASRGRKKILIDINANYKFAFGIVVENKKVYIGISNIGGETLEKRTLEAHANDTWEGMLHQIFVSMREMMANSCLEESQILGIGICMNNRAMKFMNIKTVDNLPDFTPLAAAFEREFHLPVAFDSIINGIAYAEFDFSKKFPIDENMIMVSFADSVEGTLVVKNEIYRGFHNRAMNLAHMVVNSHGAVCRCGKIGCALTEFSDEYIYVRMVDIFSKERTPKLYERVEGNINALRVADVHEYLCLGDEGVEELFETRLKSFTAFVRNLVNIIDPQRIVFYGRQFENETFMARIINHVSRELGDEIGSLVTSSFLGQKNIYLAGCTLAVRQFFVKKGGFSSK